MFNVVYFFSFSASVHPRITDKQESFIHWVLEIPFDERKCRDLITLDTLHAYYGGLVPTLAARKLNTYSCRHKFLFLCFFFPFVLTFVCLSNICLLPFAEMEAARQKALVRVSRRRPQRRLPRSLTRGRPSRKVKGRTTVASRKDQAPQLAISNQRRRRPSNPPIEFAKG